ncbi:ADP-ribosylglycohydrolase family protein [Muricomes intestini]|uniref:ADP-ribosylglycohydrolase family protein n=1 Tax=Muricomes intestini TaxID=1796634 RepID=UPI002FE0612B
MKRTITYENYFDKVYGCMIGKCVSGTAGAPYEGMKQRLNLHFTAEDADTTLPNDDLDLQVLWLDVLENKGISVTSDSLADSFLANCPYSPGEYAVFKRNYRRHIHPPFSGKYNNPYYLEGMGCPIRSEIWGCIAPGTPELAVKLAGMDGVLDHGSNSVWAECFLAALESEAFFDNNIERLIRKSLSYIPKELRIYALVSDVLAWHEEKEDYDDIYRKILRYYGHPDCTNMFQNIGITLLALLKGEGDLLKTTELAVNGGYDTDCTGATVGAVMGLILGAGELGKRYDFSDQTYSLGVSAKRRSSKISDLAEDICRVGVHYTTRGQNNIKIENCPLIPLAPKEEKDSGISIDVHYEGNPVIGPKCDGRVSLLLRNDTCSIKKGTLTIQSDTLVSSIASEALSLEPKKTLELPVDFHLSEGSGIIEDSNIVDIDFWGEETLHYSIGFAGAVPWMLYGPFWENNLDIQTLIPGQSYMEQFTGATEEERLDHIRDYHLNAFVDIKKNYMNLGSLSKGELPPGGEAVYTYEDLITMGNLVDYQGPCCVYMVRSFYLQEERTYRLNIGYSDAFCLWLNGEKLAEREDVTWWTGENCHLNQVRVKKGINHMAVRLCRRSMESQFSCSFLENDTAKLGLISFPEYVVGIANVEPSFFSG